MALKNYEVTGPDGHKMTVQLDDETAEHLGLKAAPAPKNKQAETPKNKQAPAPETK